MVQFSSLVASGAKDIIQCADTAVRLDSISNTWSTNEQPTNVIQGLKNACMQLNDDFSYLHDKVILLPLEVYKEKGAMESFHALVRSIPSMVLIPMLGASNIASQTLLGIRNSIDPQLKIKDREKYK